MNWKCKHTWKRARINTLWCLLGCSIGDFGTIFYFQNIDHDWPTFEIMGLALANGLLTSIVLETIILVKYGRRGRSLASEEIILSVLQPACGRVNC